MIQAAKGDKIVGLEAANVFKRSKNKKRLDDWEEKILHGQYLRQTKEVRKLSVLDLASECKYKKGYRRPYSDTSESECKNKLVKAKIDKSQEYSFCTVCRRVDESIDHIISSCNKLAQKEHKRRHDNLGKLVHWKLAGKCNFEARDKWYEHEPENVLENEDYKILWDFSIQTDHVIAARRPDLVVVEKKDRSC